MLLKQQHDNKTFSVVSVHHPGTEKDALCCLSCITAACLHNSLVRLMSINTLMHICSGPDNSSLCSFTHIDKTLATQNNVLQTAQMTTERDVPVEGFAPVSCRLFQQCSCLDEVQTVATVSWPLTLWFMHQSVSVSDLSAVQTMWCHFPCTKGCGQRGMMVCAILYTGTNKNVSWDTV